MTALVEKIAALDVKKQIIVVDDGSSDQTRKILKEISLKYSLELVFHEKNQGKGAAVKSGVVQAKGEFVVIQDADLEYDPKQILKLLKLAEKRNLPVVYGSRFAGEIKDMNLSFRLGNLVLTFLTNLLYGSQLTDMETCYKLFKRDIIQGINWQAKRFDFEPEITARILKKGIQIVELPITYQARTKTEGKKINWKDGVQAAILLFKLRFFEQ